MLTRRRVHSGAHATAAAEEAESEISTLLAVLRESPRRAVEVVGQTRGATGPGSHTDIAQIAEHRLENVELTAVTEVKDSTLRDCFPKLMALEVGARFGGPASDGKRRGRSCPATSSRSTPASSPAPTIGTTPTLASGHLTRAFRRPAAPTSCRARRSRCGPPARAVHSGRRAKHAQNLLGKDEASVVLYMASVCLSSKSPTT